jgi:DNA helicase HerA-like ATPase
MSISAKDGREPLAVVRGSRKGDGLKFYINEDGRGDEAIEIADGSLSVLPPEKGRTVQYIFGMSGSGKSTWIGNFVAEWLAEHPGRPVYVVSRKLEDGAFEGIKVKHVVVDESLIDEPMTVDDFPENCMTIWDDIDSIQPKRVNDAVQGLLRDVLEVGRARRVNAVVSSHLGSDYKRTRTILNEAHGITFFPYGSSAHQIRYVLKTYGGMDSEQVRKCLRLPSRWVSLRKMFPPAIIYSSGAYMLNAS